jgi:hypothetical protein
MNDDPRSTREIALLRQRVLDLESENITLRDRADRLERLHADMTLSGFVDSLALATALGEASMTDRVVSSVALEARTYLVPSGGGLALRFQPAELADRPAGLSTTSLELAKVPGPDARAAPSFYAVLEEKQRLYDGLSADSGGQVVAECATALAGSGSWSLAFLARAASSIGAFELGLARSLGDQAYVDAAEALIRLARGIAAKPRPVAGDVLSLAAALDRSTSAAAAATA